MKKSMIMLVNIRGFKTLLIIFCIAFIAFGGLAFKTNAEKRAGGLWCAKWGGGTTNKFKKNWKIDVNDPDVQGFCSQTQGIQVLASVPIKTN